MNHVFFLCFNGLCSHKKLYNFFITCCQHSRRTSIAVCNLLVVDEAQEGLSAILAQEDPNVKSFRVVSYASRACTDAERKYAPIERECLAAAWRTEKYYHYLFGGSFKLVTDHEPLVPLLNNPQKKAPMRIERMRIKIMGYDYQAEYRPGKDNPADWGSRYPLK